MWTSFNGTSHPVGKPLVRKVHFLPVLWQLLGIGMISVTGSQSTYVSRQTCAQTWLVFIRLEYVVWGEATRNNELYIGVFELHIQIPTHPNLLFLSPKPSSPASWTTGSWIIWEKPAFLFRSIYIKDLFTTITPSMTCLKIFFRIYKPSSL